MKKTAVALAVIIFSLVVSLPLTFNVEAANAQTATYTIQNVTHNVQILKSGHIIVADTVELSGQTPSVFQIGLPYIYGQHVLECIAYDSTGKELPVALGIALQGQSEFYGANIDLTGASSQTFTVAFTLSNDLLTASVAGFNASYPAYPAFVQPASQVVANIVLPSAVSILTINKPDGVINTTSYSTSNLAAYTYAPAVAALSQVGNAIGRVDVNSVESQVTFGSTGDITRVDTYSITCKQFSISFFPINLPSTATNLVIRDQFGRALSFNLISGTAGTMTANTTFLLALGQSQTTLLTLSYNLPKITADQSGQISTPLFTAADYYIQSAKVTYVLPEGARFTSSTSPSQGYSLNRGIFQETLTVAKQGVSFIDLNMPSESTVQFKYDYNYLWIAFRPALWATAIVAVGIIVVALYLHRPKAKAVPAGSAAAKTVTARAIKGAALRSEDVQQFVETYEEKNRVTEEIRTLDAKAEHGRIPRRRYKVQRKTLETRLESLTHKAGNLKELLTSAGGSYADIVRQLDAAEVELNVVDMTLKNATVQNETGQISLETYRKQLAELERRKEKAQAKVDGLLLRLRGEIR